MRTVALAVAFGMVACGGASPGTGTTLSGAQLLDRATLEQGEFYMDYSVAGTPLLADEVRDWNAAVAVRLFVLPDAVLAVREPDGSPLAERVEGSWRASEVSGPSPVTREDRGDETVVLTTDDNEPANHARTELTTPFADFEVEIWVLWELPMELSIEQVERVSVLHPGC